MKKIKIKFCDFWGGDFLPNDNFIINTLRKRYEVELSDDPDYLFCSTFGISNLNYKCVKIQFYGENLTPDFNMCDYAMAFDRIDFGDRYMRLPLYLIRDNFPALRSEKEYDAEAMLGRKFCSMVVSNVKLASPLRERFFKLLSEYKQVDSGGRMWNNVGGPVANKQEFVSQYKFNIAFENSRSHGYTTEKLMDAMTADTIPIYWGDPDVGMDFNAESFINVSDYPSLEAVVERIVQLDNDDDAYMEMLRRPWVANPDMFNWQDHLLEFLSTIIEKPLNEAKYLSEYGMQVSHRNDIRLANFVGYRLKVYKARSAYRQLKKKFHK